MLNSPSNVLHFVDPVCSAVRAVFTLVLLVQRSPPEAPLVIGEDRDTTLGKLGVQLSIPTAVFAEAMNEDNDGCRAISLEVTRKKVGGMGALDPGFGQHRRHGWVELLVVVTIASFMNIRLDWVSGAPTRR